MSKDKETDKNKSFINKIAKNNKLSNQKMHRSYKTDLVVNSLIDYNNT